MATTQSATPEAVSERVRRRTDDLLTEVVGSAQPAEVRCEAALALAALARSRAQAVELLASMLSDPEESLRRSAALALGRTRDPAAGEPLLDALEHAPELWEETAAALGELRYTPAMDRLRAMVRSAPDSRTRRGAIRALAALSVLPGARRLEDLYPRRKDDTRLLYPLL